MRTNNPATMKESVMSQSGMILLFDGARGIYIPQNFAEEMILSKWQNVDQEQIDILKQGPEHELYWQIWDEITQNAVHVDDNGYEWRLHQDGDVWVYCEKLMTAEQKYNFFEGADEDEFFEEDSVRVEVLVMYKYDKNMSKAEAAKRVLDEMDYSFKYDDGNVKIYDTDIIHSHHEDL